MIANTLANTLVNIQQTALLSIAVTIAMVWSDKEGVFFPTWAKTTILAALLVSIITFICVTIFRIWAV